MRFSKIIELKKKLSFGCPLVNLLVAIDCPTQILVSQTTKKASHNFESFNDLATVRLSSICDQLIYNITEMLTQCRVNVGSTSSIFWV